MLRPVIILLSLIGTAIVIAVVLWVNRPSPTKLVDAASRALLRGEYSTAERQAVAALEINARLDDAIVVAAEAAMHQNKTNVALEYFDRLSDDSNPVTFRGRLAQAGLLMQQWRLADAEAALRRALDFDPTHVDANRQLATLLNRGGRRWEAGRYQFELLKQRNFTVEDLLLLGNFEEPYDDPAFRAAAIAANPTDPRPRLGSVPQELLDNKYRSAEQTLRTIISQAPELPEPHALLGVCLLDRSEFEAMPAWYQGLPRDRDAYPAIWLACGRWAHAVGDHRAAARCFWQAVQLEPNYRQANYLLGTVLTQMALPEQAAPFLTRAELLSQLNDVLHPLFLEGLRAESIRLAIEILTELGRPWEAWGWRIALRQAAPDDVSNQSQLDALEVMLFREQPPRTLASHNPALAIDLSEYPQFDGGRFEASAVPNNSPLQDSTITFTEIAERTGLDFVYYNSADARTAGLRIFETTGGGTGVIDFDVDGWPDLYFTQGCQWPPEAGATKHIDRLFRNIAGEQCRDVTVHSGLGDQFYSQGISVGDIDNDGFPDIYVANIGRNRLYRNNGDGTFSDRSAFMTDQLAGWTTSCVIADINGDSIPDVFDVRYLSGDDIYHRLCGAEVQRTCAPSLFAGEQDQLLLGDGTGHLINATFASGLEGLRGKGLGVLAGDLTGNGQLSLFVANDGVANFLLTPEIADSSGSETARFRLREAAHECGLAFDRDGRAQACMGIAADDADQNGLLDLFVTNYFDDSNTLYSQQTRMLFTDATRAAELRDPGFQMLGFGTQFLDADRDGLPDLVVTNGHVDDFTHDGTPFRMRAQVYRNAGQGVFIELPSEQLGTFFAREQLGRSLARIDWNRDGRDDFATSNLDTRASLVLNQSDTLGNGIGLQFRSTRGARDAIGTTITIEVDGRTITKQLLAGDGYQASNERRLLVGIGTTDKAVRVTVHWPSGTHQVVEQLTPNKSYLIVEGRIDVQWLPDDGMHPVADTVQSETNGESRSQPES